MTADFMGVLLIRDVIPAKGGAKGQPMPSWIILTALATIAVTAGLTWVLWRINAPSMAEQQRREAAEPAATPTVASAHASHGDDDDV
ncbi:MAG: hypothetical protein R3C16_02605 [Hyphomonadaceae bacterium]